MCSPVDVSVGVNNFINNYCKVPMNDAQLPIIEALKFPVMQYAEIIMQEKADNNNNNNCRNGSCLMATSLEEKRRWLIIDASPRGQCSK